MRPAWFNIIRPLAALGLSVAVSGCALFGDAPRYRGIALTQHQLDELTPGVSSEADAEAALGPPTAHEQFEDNNWIYVSQITKLRIAQTEGIRQQHVVVLGFDNNGILRTVDRKDLQDGVKVAMDPGQTPVPGGHAGFLQQLIGGVGSYNPGILGGGANDTSGSGVSALGGGGGAGGLGGGNSGGGGF